MGKKKNVFFRPWDVNQYAVAYMGACKNVINMTVCDLADSTETNAFEFADLVVQSINEVLDLLADDAKVDKGWREVETMDAT